MTFQSHGSAGHHRVSSKTQIPALVQTVSESQSSKYLETLKAKHLGKAKILRQQKNSRNHVVSWQQTNLSEIGDSSLAEAVPVVSVRANFIQTKADLSGQHSPANNGEAELKNFEHPSMFFESGESLQTRFKLKDNQCDNFRSR